MVFAKLACLTWGSPRSIESTVLLERLAIRQNCPLLTPSCVNSAMSFDFIPKGLSGDFVAFKGMLWNIGAHES